MIFLVSVDTASVIRFSRRTSTIRRTSSSSRTTSGARATAVRYTTINGFNRANRFQYDPSTRIYRYGSFTGTRFGVDIRSKENLLHLFFKKIVLNVNRLLFLKRNYILARLWSFLWLQIHSGHIQSTR